MDERQTADQLNECRIIARDLARELEATRRENALLRERILTLERQRDIAIWHS